MASFFLAPLVETHRVLAGLSGVNLAQDLTGAIKKQTSPQCCIDHLQHAFQLSQVRMCLNLQSKIPTNAMDV